MFLVKYRLFNTTMCSTFLPIIVVHLDAEDDDAADEGDEVGDEQVDVAYQYALNHESEAAYGHHDEAGQRDAVGFAGANGLDGLWQIAQDEADAGYPAANVNQCLIIHSFLIFKVSPTKIRKTWAHDTRNAFFLHIINNKVWGFLQNCLSLQSQ